MYVMQFLTTSSLRALFAITLPFLSTISPVEQRASDSPQHRSYASYARTVRLYEVNTGSLRCT